MRTERILLSLILASAAALVGCDKKAEFTPYPEEVKANMTNECIRSYASSSTTQYSEEQGRTICECFTKETEKALPLEKMKLYEEMIAKNDQSPERKKLDEVFTKISQQCLKN